MTKPSRLRINLQYFAEGDPVDPIDPTDPPEPDESTDPAEPSDPPQEPTEDSFLEIQYNKEQLKLDKERAKELAQKGMNYDKAVERAKQEGIDTYIANQGYEWNGNPIKTEAEYKEALHEQELREKYSDLPEDVQNELIESKKFRNEHKAKETAAEQRVREYEEKEKNDVIFKEFVKEYPDVKELPQPVIDEINNGVNLLDAYARYENKTLKEQLAALKEGKEIEKQNADNEQASTGSVRGQGDVKPARFTQEQVAKMSDSEMNKNWDAVQTSMKAWKK